MNSLFTQVKSQVTTRQAAERYGIPVNRSGMARCIFHDDRHPSMKLNERFYCFGCHVTGDVIDFTAKLFGLSPYEAAKKLADDFDIRPLPPGQSAPIPKLPAEVMEGKEEQRVLGLLVDYERLLTKWKKDFAPATPDTETWDERFCQAVRHQIPVGYAIECLISSDPVERKGMMDYIRSTDTAAQIENILKNGIPEVMNGGRKKIVRLDWWPEWFTGKTINEPIFCREFLEKHRLAYSENCFFSPNGKVTDENKLRSAIYHLLEPFVVSSLSKKVDDIMKDLRIKAQVKELLPQTDRIHVQNGTLFLDGTFAEEKAEIVRSRFPVRYDPNAKPPTRWLQFLSDLLWPEDIPTLQEFIGYGLIPSNAGQKMMVIKGSGGEGKSQIGHVLARLFGPNMKDGSVGKVSENPFARADLEHIHLMVDDDMRLEALKQTNYVKSIVTAKGKMDLERKNKQSYQGYMYARILAFSNGDLVSLYDRSDGFFRRQLILTTKRKPPDRIDDPDLSDNLCGELEGIFLWAFEGLQRLVKNSFRFTESDRAKLNREMVRKDANNIELFMESQGYITRSEELTVSSRQLAQIYDTWCDENAYPAMKSKTLIEYLTANQEKFGIVYTNNIVNAANRRVRGFKGIGPAIRLPGTAAGGWQIVDPEDNPFKNT